MKRAITMLATCAFLSGCMTTDHDSAGNPRLAVAQLFTGAGVEVGTASIVSRGQGIEVLVNVTQGLPQGVLGMHLHAVGTCTPPGFSSAGPHLNPQGRKHGTLNPEGAHFGDLPNIAVNAAGKGSARIMIDGPQAHALAALFDADGTALVIHRSADDYRTDPSGNSGDRIACGQFVRVP